ncbi:MAG: NAD(P)H-quinone oxidoreductase [Caldimicrobium thiodismutans]|uniref:NAD(P)H-quinone oxidoreductase n=1 Tax=Caldimicrobium thiodismutans TaxID=1653476 RepID=A0A2N7PKV2_9BACT|nr:MAG: NAD(P)H-quinone oxidoreductase [Caldimicrobium thiodismutans]
MKVLIVYYSTYGNTYKMALEIAEGVKKVDGAEPIIRTVPELIPEKIINSREDMKRGRDLQKGVPLVTLDDFREAGAIAFGTPTRFGVVSAQLKNQIDRLSPLWQEGALEGKPAGIFVSTSTLHGGQEMTIFSLLPVLLHLGMIFVGVPYSVKNLFTTKGGGSPYGPGHIAGPDNLRELDEDEKAILRSFGKRLAEIGLKLKKS